jgi:ABC-type uncharacterized transport system auxiliary subunit
MGPNSHEQVNWHEKQRIRLGLVRQGAIVWSTGTAGLYTFESDMRNHVLLLILLPLMASGCFTPSGVAPLRYFDLGVPETRNAMPLTVEVQTTEPYFDRIITRSEGRELLSSDIYRWARPADKLLETYLQDSFGLPGRKGAHSLNVVIRRFEFDKAAGMAVLEVNFSIGSPGTAAGAPINRHTLSKPVTGSNPEDIVAGMTAAVDSFVQRINLALSSQP